IEVLTDGASAIYGTDAIAGVVNIILRDDFDGAESRLGMSTLTGGGGEAFQAGQTFGVSEEHAHGLISYEYSSDNPLDANDRSFSRAAADPTYLLPRNEKHGFFASGGVTLAEAVRISGDAYYNNRNTRSFSSDLDPFFGLTNVSQSVAVEQLGGAVGVEV